MRRFELTEGTSRKFWEVRREGTTLVLAWGRIGTAGQTKSLAFATEVDADAEREKRIAIKTREGYDEVTAAPSGPATGATAGGSASAPSSSSDRSSRSKRSNPAVGAPPPAGARLVFSDSVRARAIARRGGHYPPPATDAKETVSATFSALKAEWKKLARHQAAEHPRRAWAEDANLAWVSDVMVSRTLPHEGLDGGRLATLFAALWNVCKDYTLALRGPMVEAFATRVTPAVLLEALLGSHTLSIATEGNAWWLERSLRAVTLATCPPIPHGELDPWRAMRHGLARASAEEHDAAETVAIRAWTDAKASVRLALAFAFPHRTDWASSIAEDVIAGLPAGAWETRDEESRALYHGGGALLASAPNVSVASRVAEGAVGLGMPFLEALVDALGEDALAPVAGIFVRTLAGAGEEAQVRAFEALTTIDGDGTRRLLKEHEASWTPTPVAKRARAFLVGSTRKTGATKRDAGPRAVPVIEPIPLPPPPSSKGLPGNVAALVALAPPPRAPLYAVGEWAAVEAELGTALPADYRALVTVYGSGLFADWLGLFDPFDPRPHVRLAEQVRLLGQTNRDLRADFPDFFPHPLFPEPGGLLPFARANTSHLYWVTRGKPDAWTIVVMGRAEGEHEAYRFGAAEFLLRWLGGKLGRKVPPGFGSIDPKPYFLSMETTPRANIRAVLSPSDTPFAKRAATLTKAVERVAGPSRSIAEGDEDEASLWTAAGWLVRYVEKEGGGPTVTVQVPHAHVTTARRAIALVAAVTGSDVVSVDP